MEEFMREWGTPIGVITLLVTIAIIAVGPGGFILEWRADRLEERKRARRAMGLPGEEI